MKKCLTALLALVLALGLAACTQKGGTTENGGETLPKTPIRLDVLRVEFTKGERSADDLLALKEALPPLLIKALGENNVEVGRVDITFGASAEATARSLAEGGIDVAFLPLFSLFSCEEGAVRLALVQKTDDDTALDVHEAVALTQKNKAVAPDGFLAALRGAVEALCADEEGRAALSLYEAAPDYRSAEMSDFASERAAYEKDNSGAIN